MKPLKVALVGIDPDSCPEGVPDWVPRELSQKDIDFHYQECTNARELQQHAGDADIVWLYVGSPILSAENLNLLPRCGAIIRTGSGTDNVAVAEATKLGIVVANTPDASTEPVSDHAIGLMLAVGRRIPSYNRRIREGVWNFGPRADHCHLYGRTVGLVGFGRIAQGLAKKLQGFQVKVLAYDPFVSEESMASHHVSPTELHDLLSRSDFVSVHCPLTKETNHLIGERELRQMKPTAILVNTSRGPVVDEAALAQALKEGWIRGAGLDVFEKEPLESDSSLLQLENVVMTPHMAAYSVEYFNESWRLSVETIFDLAEGRWPRSCVNRDVKPRMKLS